MRPEYRNGCYIRACWTSRQETAQALADRFVSLIDRLSRLDPVFELWTSGAKGPRKFETIRENYAETVEACLARDDYGEPDPVYGYWFGAYTRGQPNSRSYVINVNAGGYKPTAENQNQLFFENSAMAVPEPTSVTYPIFESVLLAIIETLAPDDCLVMPRSLLDLIDLDRHFRDPWMQYLSKPFADLITPPDTVLVEHLPNGGLLMSATTDKFDVDNPSHLAAARAIGAATLPLEKLPYVYHPKTR